VCVCVCVNVYVYVYVWCLSIYGSTGRGVYPPRGYGGAARTRAGGRVMSW